MKSQDEQIYIDDYVIVIKYADETSDKTMSQIKDILLSGISNKINSKVAKFDKI